jgi:large subunit ribosomal protein LP0
LNFCIYLFIYAVCRLVAENKLIQPLQDPSKLAAIQAAAAAAPAADASSTPAAAPAAKEAAKEEPAEESDDDMGFGLFD